MTEATKQVGETTCSYDCKYTFLKVGMLQIFNVYNALPFYACLIHTKEVFSKYFVFLASPNIPQNITTLESFIVYENIKFSSQLRETLMWKECFAYDLRKEGTPPCQHPFILIILLWIVQNKNNAHFHLYAFCLQIKTFLCRNFRKYLNALFLEFIFLKYSCFPVFCILKISIKVK